MGILNLGTPIAVDVSRIEHELSLLWKSASESEEDRSVIRACSCNLVSIVRDSDEAANLPEIIARVSEYHPSRSFVAYIDTDIAASEIRAWINTQCTVPFAGAPQVCCETVTLCAKERQSSHLMHTLVSLLVPDLPVFLYWRTPHSEELALVEMFSQFSDLLIVDSRTSKQNRIDRDRVTRLLIDPPHDAHCRDLNWSRLTAWRDLIAQFFDSPSDRDFVWDISEVEIVRAVAEPNSLPTRALLLTGWLADRLSWKLESAKKDGAGWISSWEAPQGSLVVRFKETPVVNQQPPGIRSVSIKTRSGGAFEVQLDPDTALMTSVSEIAGSRFVHSVPEDASDEISLIVRELSISGADPSFRRAYAAAAEVEQAFLSGGIN